MKRNAYGFTIVELLIVIVVIAILAAISIVAYTGIQERARFSAMRSELASLHKALQLYHADNGHYPITPTGALGYCHDRWCGYGQAVDDEFIPGLVPEYIPATPQLPSSSVVSNSYLYRSPDGVNYKLIRHRNFTEYGGLPVKEREAMKDLMATDCPASHINITRWGYWNSDISKCW